MLLTQVAYFVSLAREQHFGRAATACHVSQSTLSEAIHKLEAELDMPLVRRGRSFEGLTPEGEQLLVWARRIVADQEALRSAVETLRTGLVGTIRIGVIPSATRSAAALVDRFCTDHPLARVDLQLGLPSHEIVGRIRRFELDAGIVYPVPEDSDDLTMAPLYVEHQRVLMSTMRAAGLRSIRGRDLNELPLCLLAPSMHARQMLDAALQHHRIELRPQVEADSVDALMEMVASGHWVGVAPVAQGDASALPSGIAGVDLVDPRVSAPVVLAIPAGEPVSLLARAMMRAARGGSPTRPPGVLIGAAD